MIEVLRFNEKWRLGIKNEVLEFDKREDLDKAIKDILTLKETYEPKKEESNVPDLKDVMEGVMDLLPKSKK